MRSYLIFAIALALSSAPAMANKQDQPKGQAYNHNYDLKAAKGARAIDPGKTSPGATTKGTNLGTRRR